MELLQNVLGSNMQSRYNFRCSVAQLRSVSSATSESKGIKVALIVHYVERGASGRYGKPGRAGPALRGESLNQES